MVGVRYFTGEGSMLTGAARSALPHRNPHDINILFIFINIYVAIISSKLFATKSYQGLLLRVLISGFKVANSFKRKGNEISGM